MTHHIWWQTDTNGRRRLILKTCDDCPCRKDDDRCEPKDIASITVPGHMDGTPSIVDLTKWAGEKVGYPKARWRLIEVSDCYLYASGEIDEKGRLVGLPKTFSDDYSYEGRLRLQQGCPDEFGVVHWPEVSGCDSLNISN